MHRGTNVYVGALGIVLIVLALLSIPILSRTQISHKQASGSEANAVSEPTVNDTIEIGDSEVANVTLNINVTNITNTPALFFRWIITGVDSSYFNVNDANYRVYYINERGELVDISSYVTQFTTDAENGEITLELRLESTDAINMSVYAIVSIPSKPVTTTFDIYLTHTLSYVSGDNYGTLTDFATTTVRIIHKVPEVSVSVEPSINNRGFGAPGTVFNISLSAFDASGIYNVSVTILNSSNNIVDTWTLNSSITGNSTRFNYTVYWDTTNLPEDTYTVIVRAWDILVEEPGFGEANVAIELRKGIHVPEDFATLSEALAYPGVIDGTVIYVSGNITEENTVNVNKAVTIAGLNSASILFSGVDVGLNITKPATIANIGIQGASTAFKLVNVNGSVMIENVHVVASKFIEVEAPYNIEYWNHSIKDSTLNGSKVGYLVGKGEVNESYIELHLVFGNFTIRNANITLLEIVNSTASMLSSSVEVLKAVGSSINAYNTMMSQWLGIDSVYTGYSQVIVRVVFNNLPVENALVKLENSLAETVNTTNSEGYTWLWGTVTICHDTCQQDYIATVTAYKKGLENKTTIDLHEPPVTIVLSLPVPKLSVTVTDVKGNTVTNILPGMLLMVNASYDLLTYNGTATIKITLYRNGEPDTIVTVPLHNSKGYTRIGLMVPYATGSYSIGVSLVLEELPEISISWP